MSAIQKCRSRGSCGKGTGFGVGAVRLRFFRHVFFVLNLKSLDEDQSCALGLDEKVFAGCFVYWARQIMRLINILHLYCLRSAVLPELFFDVECLRFHISWGFAEIQASRDRPFFGV